MRALLACILLAACGCDHPDTWEFCVSVPGDTSIDRLMDMRERLKASGYKRFRIHTVDFGRAIVIYATERDTELLNGAPIGNSIWRVDVSGSFPLEITGFDSEKK